MTAPVINSASFCHPDVIASCYAARRSSLKSATFFQENHMHRATLFKYTVVVVLGVNTTLVCAASDDSHRAGSARGGDDFGAGVEQQLKAKSEKWFGVKQALDASAPATTGAYRTAAQSADEQVLVAKGLKVEYVTRTAADKTDMMVLWPNGQHPTHIISAVEESSPRVIGKLPGGIDKLTPSVQRIELATGKSEIILRGLAGADGIRMTAWGTLLVPEESASGNAYEIIDPLHVTNHTVTDRALGTIVDADGKPSNQVVKRSALPTMAWEGMAVLRSGVVIAGDELRPGSPAKANGGSIFKFVPSVVTLRPAVPSPT